MNINLYLNEEGQAEIAHNGYVAKFVSVGVIWLYQPDGELLVLSSMNALYEILNR